MKLRMYLRGLGIGMVVTALVLSFGMKPENNKMSDAEIRAKAKELGMVDESSTLKDSTALEEKSEAKETAAEEDVNKPDVKVEAKTDKKPEEKAEAEKKVEAKKEPEKKPVAKNYTLKVERGYSSDRVARILEEAGVVDNAVSFDKYLCSNGYDHRISVGAYNIPAGADYSTIAKLITHSN